MTLDLVDGNPVSRIEVERYSEVLRTEVKARPEEATDRGSPGPGARRDFATAASHSARCRGSRRARFPRRRRVSPRCASAASLPPCAASAPLDTRQASEAFQYLRTYVRNVRQGSDGTAGSLAPRRYP